MTTPVIALLGFALWTLLILFATVGVYRWSRIFTGRTRVSAWTAEPGEGGGFYPRAMRAHMNCVENLPVFGAIVYASDKAGVETGLMSALALFVLAARIAQSAVHIAFTQTDAVVLVRFGFYVTQILAMIAMAIIVLGAFFS